MYDNHPWRAELLGALAALTATLWIGSLFDATMSSLLVFALLLLLRHLIEIMRLERWLRVGGDVPSAGSGIWARIYDHLYRIKQQNKLQKKRRNKILSRFRKATGALPDATAVLSENNEIDWFNKPAAHLLGLQKTDRGQHIGNLLRHPDFVDYLHRDDDNGPVSIPAPTDPNIILEIRIVSYGGGLRLLIARDVTQFRHMERMRSDFVANASHELRTPLTVLKGYLETLQDNPELPPSLTNALERMDEQSTRMQHLIDDLLLLTKLETTQLQESSQEPVNMAALLESICRESELIDSAHHTIDLSIESEAELIGNSHELRSAFTNLISNALKYSPADADIRVRWYQADDGVRLDVIDQGEGIAPMHLPQLTERFYRVDVNRSRQGGGTGLGLAIVKHVLSRHDALLHIESQPGKGSCFSCRFPAERVIRKQETDDEKQVTGF
jgi:two-component system, OmpR family, phosphate regulon sensor histidine kinase PhoR